MTIWDWVGWIIAAGWLWMLWPSWLGLFRVTSISRITPVEVDDPDLPFVSIIMPARDEAAGVEEALHRLLALDYPRYELIAIDDRSQDDTGRIMDRVAGDDPRCRVLHLTELPAGWLGKNHANMLGVSHARGDYLLFTDGDVQFSPELLRRSVSAMRTRKLDHLVLLPDMLPANFWEEAALNYFTVLFCIATRFPLAPFRWANHAYIGVGAFNLVTRRAYEAIGTHEKLRLEVVDDLMLGKLIKRAGFTQEAIIGAPLLRVKWQTGIRGIVRGMEKNAFAAARFSVPLAIAAILMQPLLAFAPFVLTITGPARIPFAIIAIFTVATMTIHAVMNRFSPFVALVYPFGAIVFGVSLLRSMRITLQSGGVTWRDTFYPLPELRRGMLD